MTKIRIPLDSNIIYIAIQYIAFQSHPIAGSLLYQFSTNQFNKKRGEENLKHPSKVFLFHSIQQAEKSIIDFNPSLKLR